MNSYNIGDLVTITSQERIKQWATEYDDIGFYSKDHVVFFPTEYLQLCRKTGRILIKDKLMGDTIYYIEIEGNKIFVLKDWLEDNI